jgi:hypothetical protein
MMVTGFSLVLYSRLSIIVHNRRIRQLVLAMIIFNGVVWHTAMTTLSTGKAIERYGGHRHKLLAWEYIDYYFERVQIIMFCTQETVILILYVHAAYRYLKSGFTDQGKTRRVMTTLVLVQLTIILIDIGLITIDFAGYLQLKLFINSFVYSAKLELEVVVLNQLVELSQLGISGVPSFSIAVTPCAKADLSEPNTVGGHGMITLVQPVSLRKSLDLESQQSRESKASGYSLDFITTPNRI